MGSNPTRATKSKMKVIVYHSYYGCETGCCGHTVELEDGTSKFYFSHPYSDDALKIKEFIKELVTDEFGEEHVSDIDWDNCIISDD